MKARKPNKQAQKAICLFFLSDFSQGPRIEHMQILREYQNNSATKKYLKGNHLKLKKILKHGMDNINILNVPLAHS